MAITVDKLIQIGRLASGTDAEITTAFGAIAKDGFLYQVTDKDSYRIGKPDGSLTDPVITKFNVLGDTGSLAITQLIQLGIKGGDLLKTVFSGGDLTLDFDFTGSDAYKMARVNAAGTDVEWADALTIGAGSNGILTFVDGVLNIDKIGVVDVFTDNAVTNTGAVDSALNAYISLAKCAVNGAGVLEVTEDRGAGVQTYKVEHGDLVVLVAAKESWVCTGLSGTSAGFAKMSADFSEAAILAMISGGEGIAYNNSSGVISLEYLRRVGSSLEYNDDTTWDKVWTAKNDGTGSGLDADLLDGKQGADYFSKENISASITGQNGAKDYNTDFQDGGLYFSYYSSTNHINSPTGDYWLGHTLKGQSNAYAQLAYRVGINNHNTNEFWYRKFNNTNTWSDWVKVWNSGHFTQADIDNWDTAYNERNLDAVLKKGSISNEDIHLNGTSSKIGLGGLGTSGTGGWFQGTGESGTNEAGYGSWMTNNLYFNGTDWTKPRGSTTASAVTINHHKDFSIFRVSAGGNDGDTYSFADDTYSLLKLGSQGHLYIKDGGASLVRVASRNYVTNTINTQYFNDLTDTDADKLGGQNPSYYTNTSNLGWQLANRRFGYYDGSDFVSSSLKQDNSSQISLEGNGVTVFKLKDIGTGQPSSVIKVLLEGRENRGQGIFFKDTSNAGVNWFTGINYNTFFSRWSVGYDASTNQSEYTAKSILSVFSNGRVGVNLGVSAATVPFEVNGESKIKGLISGGTHTGTFNNSIDLSYSASKANVAILFPNSSAIQFQEDSANEGRIKGSFSTVLQLENTGDIYFTRASQLEANITAGFFNVTNDLRVSGLTGDKYLFNDATNKVTEKTLEQLQKDVLGSSNTANVFDVTQNTHGFTVGGMIYWDSTNSEWVGSKADIEDNVQYSIGVVVEVINTNSFKIATTGVFNISNHEFAIGANYAVSTTTAQGVVNASTLDVGSNIIWIAFTVIDANRILIQNKKYLV